MGAGVARKKGFNAVRGKVKELMIEGFSASQLASLSSTPQFNTILLFALRLTRAQLHNVIVLHPTLIQWQKSKCALAMAEADKALVDGSDELWILEVALG